MTRPLTAEEAMERARELELKWVFQQGPGHGSPFFWYASSHAPVRTGALWFNVRMGFWMRLGPGSPNPDWRETKARVR